MTGSVGNLSLRCVTWSWREGTHSLPSHSLVKPLLLLPLLRTFLVPSILPHVVFCFLSSSEFFLHLAPSFLPFLRTVPWVWSSSPHQGCDPKSICIYYEFSTFLTIFNPPLPQHTSTTYGTSISPQSTRDILWPLLPPPPH